MPVDYCSRLKKQLISLVCDGLRAKFGRDEGAEGKLKGLLGTPIFRRLSTKMVAGFVALMVIFSTVGLVVSREVNETRDKANEALDRAGAVLHMEEAKAAASDQIQANYQPVSYTHLTLPTNREV